MKTRTFILEPKRFSIQDGPGIRTVFFLKGCPLHCIWCHNPESISPERQTAFFQNKCTNCGECINICPHGAQTQINGKHHFISSKCTACGQCIPDCYGKAMQLYGRSLSLEEALAIAIQDKPFYDQSGGGVTVSGGEPFFHPEFTIGFLKKLKESSIHTAADSCAFVRQKILEKALPWTDLFLIDFKHADPQKHKLLTGQSNELILRNLTWLSKCGKPIEIRIPLVPGCNDSEENLKATGQYLSSLNIQGVKLLPYHSLAAAKYEALGINEPSLIREEPVNGIKQATEILAGFGLKVISDQ